MSAAHRLPVMLGGLLMLLGIVIVGDVAHQALFLACGTICLIASGALRLQS